MRMLKMFRSSPHRSSKISEKLIIAKFDESLSGQYKCGDAVLHLGKDGKFTCGTTGAGLPTLFEHGVTDGNRIVGTYNRFGKPNLDIHSHRDGCSSITWWKPPPALRMDRAAHSKGCPRHGEWISVPRSTSLTLKI